MCVCFVCGLFLFYLGFGLPDKTRQKGVKRTVRKKTETPLPAATAAALVTYEENTNN